MLVVFTLFNVYWFGRVLPLCYNITLAHLLLLARVYPLVSRIAMHLGHTYCSHCIAFAFCNVIRILHFILQRLLAMSVICQLPPVTSIRNKYSVISHLSNNLLGRKLWHASCLYRVVAGSA